MLFYYLYIFNKLILINKLSFKCNNKPKEIKYNSS